MRKTNGRLHTNDLCPMPTLVLISPVCAVLDREHICYIHLYYIYILYLIIGVRPQSSVIPPLFFSPTHIPLLCLPFSPCVLTCGCRGDRALLIDFDCRLVDGFVHIQAGEAVKGCQVGDSGHEQVNDAQALEALEARGKGGTQKPWIHVGSSIWVLKRPYGWRKPDSQCHLYLYLILFTINHDHHSKVITYTVHSRCHCSIQYHINEINLHSSVRFRFLKTC